VEALRRDVIRVVLAAALVVLAQVIGPRREPPGQVVRLDDESDGVFCSDCGEYKVPNEDGHCPDCGKKLVES
jgi:predicted RNA-binding protein